MYEIDFLPVGPGNGDAICIRYGNDQSGYYLHVVDGGYTDTADTIISHIETHYGKHYFINHMVLSHADNDHAAGLIGALNRLKVENLWINRPWLYAAEILPHFHGNYTLYGLIQKIRDMHPYLVELEKIANSKGTLIHEVFQGNMIGPFRVLAPSRRRYISLLPDLDKTPTSYMDEQVAAFLKGMLEGTKNWLDETWDIETLSNNPRPATSASNETCVVQHAIIENSRILLTADVGPSGLNEAADYANSLGLLQPPHFVQVPHHGNVTPAVLDRWLGPRMAKGGTYGRAFCSIGVGKFDYPRAQVKNAFQRRGYPVHVTRGVSKTHFYGRELRPGWSPSTPELFADRVEL